jgi:hypothetical protein
LDEDKGGSNDVDVQQGADGEEGFFLTAKSTRTVTKVKVLFDYFVHWVTFEGSFRSDGVDF